MDLQIIPRPLEGGVRPPGSKSAAHRMLLCAALAGGESRLFNVPESRDVEATLRCVEALGGRWERGPGGGLKVQGIGRSSGGELPRFDCGESGSTLRFLIPIALAVAGGGVFTGGGRLMERPQQPYFDLFREKGIFYEQTGDALTVRGRLEPGEYRLPGQVSSQFFTGLLLALPLLGEKSSLVSTTALESADYVAMTIQAQAQAGVEISGGEGRYEIPAGAYRPVEATVEGDWSQAAFWYAASFLARPLAINGLNPDSLQGDKCIGALYWKLARPGDVEIDVSACPDLAPPLAVMAAVRRGNTRLTNAARLRMKESDRLKTTAAMVNALGGQAEEGAESLTLHGVHSLTGGTVEGANDHRIVMAAAVAAIACKGPVLIRGAEAVGKSYPDFFEEYQRLGGEVHGL